MAFRDLTTEQKVTYLYSVLKCRTPKDILRSNILSTDLVELVRYLAAENVQLIEKLEKYEIDEMKAELAAAHKKAVLHEMGFNNEMQ